MKRRMGFKLVGGIALSVFLPARGQAQAVQDLVVNDPVNYPSIKQFEIDVPGKYRLAADQIQRTIGSWTGHSVLAGNMLNIYCGNVDVDLNGHILGADSSMGGVRLSRSTNIRFLKRFPKRYGSASLDNRFVNLHNGTVDFARGTATGIAVNFSDIWHEADLKTVGRPLVNGAPLDDIRYDRNEYHFDNLRVLANRVALAVEGSHTVIRNCVIESADKAAIFIAGDHVTIENCEIRLRRSHLKGQGQPRAAIVLRDGASAIIRNNRIRIDEDDGGSELHCILVRDGARDVVVEGNTFINVKGEPVTLAEGAQATVRDNRFEKRWL